MAVVGGVGEVIIAVLKWIILLPFALGVVVSLGSLLILGSNAVAVVLNGTVLADLFSLIQMWLPFNLNVLTAWISTIVVLYISYRLSISFMLFMSRFVSR